jgi:hypothetical protein
MQEKLNKLKLEYNEKLDKISNTNEIEETNKEFL